MGLRTLVSDELLRQIPPAKYQNGVLWILCCKKSEEEVGRLFGTYRTLPTLHVGALYDKAMDGIVSKHRVILLSSLLGKAYISPKGQWLTKVQP